MEITTKIGCKIDCIYCPQEKFAKAYKKRSNVLMLSFDVFKACVDKIPVTEEIRFSGMCEPWLNPECTKMLLYAYKKGFIVRAFTTLVGMSLSDIDLIESIPPNKILIKVHLPSREGYEKINVNNDYLKILKKIYKSKINKLFHCNSKNIHPRVREILVHNESYYWKLDNRGHNIKIKNVSIPVKRHGTIGCLWKWRPETQTYLKTSAFTVLLPNGEVLFCCQDFGMKHVLGNLLLSDYDSLFRSDEFTKIVIGMSDESVDILCRYCEHSWEVADSKRSFKISPPKDPP